MKTIVCRSFMHIYLMEKCNGSDPFSCNGLVLVPSRPSYCQWCMLFFYHMDCIAACCSVGYK